MKGIEYIKALILGCFNIGGKIIGLIFIFKLSNDLKPFGLYLYTYAYIPFSLFLDISAFGLIPGVSKNVSKLMSEKEETKTYYLLRQGTLFSVFLGVIFFILLNIFNEKILAVSLYEGYSQEEYSLILYHLKIASISLLFFPLISFLRGYLQGKSKMIKSGISIILENIVRVILYLYISKNIDSNTIYKVFNINSISYLVSLLILLIFVFKDYFKSKTKYNCIPSLIKISIPFGIVTMFFTFYQLIDSITLSPLGIDPHIYTAYMFETNRLIFIPIAFSQSVGATLNSKINSLFTQAKLDEASNLAKSITRLMIYLLIPIILVYVLFSKEIYTFFYNDNSLYYILSHTTILIFFIGFYKVIIGISSGMPKFNFIVFSTFIGALAKISLNIVLVSKYNYLGAIISTIVAISICMLAAYYVLNRAKIKLFISNIISILTAIISVFIAIYFTYLFKPLLIGYNTTPFIEFISIIILFVSIYSFIVSFLRLVRVSKTEIIHKI